MVNDKLGGVEGI